VIGSNARKRRPAGILLNLSGEIGGKRHAPLSVIPEQLFCYREPLM
jgi:hypothetical protein